MRKSFLTLAIALVWAAAAWAQAPEAAAELHWYKGNTHTHSTNSDGDSKPVVVARWYRDHGYDFLLITDHNTFTSPETVQKELESESDKPATRPFLLVGGEEVTSTLERPDRKSPVHLCALGTTRKIGAQQGQSVAAILRSGFDATELQGGVAVVNHPNFRWAISPDELAATSGITHMEVYNGHPTVNNLGGGDRPGNERLWDMLLSNGQRVFGTATDDAHAFAKQGPDVAAPGRGWIVVRAGQLTSEAIVSAMKRGDFYASTGVEFDDVSMTQSTLRLRIKRRSDELYSTEFIGKDGTRLAQVAGLEVAHELKAGEPYVRAHVLSSNGRQAWSQPLFAPVR